MSNATITHDRVQVRHPALDDPLADLPKYFMGVDAPDEVVGCHLIAVLSAIFPPGEDFFVRSVARVRHRVGDPELQAQVDAFIGQEDQHGEQHRRLNERLAAHGYPVRRVSRFVDRVARAVEGRLSPEANLAVTAALEHHTAVVAETLLDIEASRDHFAHDGVLALFCWHALEESEHKAVAFDVYREIGGTEAMRIRAMHVMNVLFAVEVALATAESTLRDRDAWRHPVVTLRSVGALARSPFLSRRLVRRVADYLDQGFHPDDADTEEMIARWRRELFGADGRLVDTAAGAA
ncbi:metal-dependent hydrolase [Iamia majanohamensis]|uniref:Metal-dependent hydrolase n=1 Tax=Iamia majanohamensis TaxID=467976 RepID=A0AAE9YFD6_9ACTN|nr:metal-dependent hydrolase [Iamia majanohamensis]WCO66806.1 metal-dependent hydrolase [Iamia majanohamensis]